MVVLHDVDVNADIVAFVDQRRARGRPTVASVGSGGPAAVDLALATGYAITPDDVVVGEVTDGLPHVRLGA